MMNQTRQLSEIDGPKNIGTQLRLLARWLLNVAWALSAIAMFLPAYNGEFFTPGSQITLLGFAWLFGSISMYIIGIFHGYANLAVVLFLVFTITPIILYILTPLCYSNRLDHKYFTLLFGSIMLILSGNIWLFYVLNYNLGSNNILIGGYILPFPLLLAGLALFLLAIGVRRQANNTRHGTA